MPQGPSLKSLAGSLKLRHHPQPTEAETATPAAARAVVRRPLNRLDEVAASLCRARAASRGTLLQARAVVVVVHLALSLCPFPPTPAADTKERQAHVLTCFCLFVSNPAEPFLPGLGRAVFVVGVTKKWMAGPGVPMRRG